MLQLRWSSVEAKSCCRPAVAWCQSRSNGGSKVNHGDIDLARPNGRTAEVGIANSFENPSPSFPRDETGADIFWGAVVVWGITG